MKEFIESVSRQIGIDEATARSATGGLLGFVQGKVAGGDFSELMEALPGSAEVMEQAASSGESGGRGGLLGGLAGKALSAVGAGGLGSGMELAGQLKQQGLESGQIGTFVSMFVQYVKGQAGSGLFEKLATQLPELKKFAG